MSLLTETKEIQSRMAEYCRTGNETILPGVIPERLHHYRRLIISIIEEHLESSFSITHEYIQTEIWDDMLHDFFSTHDCQSYQVWKIAGEFYEYALNTNAAQKYQLPFLKDLLKFEWEELRLYNMENCELPAVKIEGDMLTDYFVVNPEHVLFPLEYPIHIKKPFQALECKGNYFVLLYREKQTGKVQFMDLSVWFALIIEQIAIGNITLNALLNAAPDLFGKIDMEELKTSTVRFIDDLQSKSFILGFRE